MADINKEYASNFIKASDVQDRGDVTFICGLAAHEEVGRDKESKLVLKFSGCPQYPDLAKKGLCLNKTNATKIATILGSTDTDQWQGKPIALYATTCQDPSGKEVDCVRVHPARKAAPPQGQMAPNGGPKHDTAYDIP